jgi:tetratricopeptide (TPR) repeat protein
MHAAIEPIGVPALANALNTLSNSLHFAGKESEALEAARECAQIRFKEYTRLRRKAWLPFGRAKRQQDLLAAESSLAAAFTTISSRLASNGEREDALAAIDDAVDILRRLVKSTKGTIEHDLQFASALHNLAVALDDCGQTDRARAVIADVVQVYRGGVAEVPSMFETDLARALSNQSNYSASAGDLDGALASIEEAVELRRHLAVIDEASHAPSLIRSLVNLATHAGAASLGAQALAAGSGAYELVRNLTERGIWVDPDLSVSATVSYAGALANDGQHAQAIALLDGLNAPEATRAIAIAKTNLVAELLSKGRVREALNLTDEAISSYEAWCSSAGDSDGSLHAHQLHLLASIYGREKRFDEGLIAVDRSIAIYETLSDGDPECCQNLARALATKSQLLRDLGRADEANESLQSAINTLDKQLADRLVDSADGQELRRALSAELDALRPSGTPGHPQAEADTGGP